MEKLQIFLVILLGLGTFIWRMVRKAIETTARESRERPRPKVPSLPDTSFQELLKQMQAQNQSGPATPTPRQSPAPTTPAGRPLPRETAPTPQSLERPEVRPVSLEEKATARANQETAPKVRRAATLPRATTAIPKAYNLPARTTSSTRRTVRDTLRSASDVRAAFVLSEVLRRKF